MRSRLLPLLQQGVTRARSLGRSILVSRVESIECADPLTALAPTGAPQMYWGVPRDGFQLTAVGAAVTLTGSGPSRFADIASEWKRLADAALVQEDASREKGAGPVLVGGFSFDPDGPRTGTWRGFPAAAFVVPALTVACSGSDCRLTLTALVDADSDVAGLAAALDARRVDVLERLAAGDGHGGPGVGTSAAVAIETDTNAEAAWRGTVARAIGAIRDGRMEKVVLARALSARLAAPDGFDARRALAHLRQTQPAAFIFGLWRDDAVFLGATPERLACLDGREIETSVLAGSAPRGSTPADDAQRIAELRGSAKDREEHEIVRRDIHARLDDVCEAIVSPTDPALILLPTVHHLHTAVRGRLRPGRTVFDVIARLHPTPALGGAPRGVALDFLREHERLDRGWYAGPIGWVDGHAAEFAVALRSALVRHQDASLFAGCGIVAGSDPDAEFAESAVKLQTALGALRAGLALPRA